jgi:hypothetical protein
MELWVEMLAAPPPPSPHPSWPTLPIPPSSHHGLYRRMCASNVHTSGVNVSLWTSLAITIWWSYRLTCWRSESAMVGEEVGEVAGQQSTRCRGRWMGSCLLTGLVFSLFWSDLTVGIDTGEFGSSSGGSNHLVIEGPSSDGNRVVASLDDVNSPSSSFRSVPKGEETHCSPSQWAPVFSIPGALCCIMVAIGWLEFGLDVGCFFSVRLLD